MELRSFRGLIASASLKHVVILKVLHGVAEFPRLDCLGLIEARGHSEGSAWSCGVSEA